MAIKSPNSHPRLYSLFAVVDVVVAAAAVVDVGVAAAAVVDVGVAAAAVVEC